MVRKHIVSNNTSGFTMIEILFSLSITILITLSLTSIVRVVLYSPKSMHLNEDIHIATTQITNTLYQGYDFSAGSSLLYTDDKDRQFTIELDNGKIVKTPGYVTFLHDVESLYFEIINNKVYMNLTRDNRNYVFWIASNIVVEEDEKEE